MYKEKIINIRQRNCYFNSSFSVDGLMLNCIIFIKRVSSSNLLQREKNRFTREPRRTPSVLLVSLFFPAPPFFTRRREDNPAISLRINRTLGNFNFPLDTFVGSDFRGNLAATSEHRFHLPVLAKRRRQHFTI